MALILAMGVLKIILSKQLTLSRHPALLYFNFSRADERPTACRQLLCCFQIDAAHSGAGATECLSFAQKGGRALQQSAPCITSTTTVNYTTLGLASDPWCLQVGKATPDVTKQLSSNCVLPHSRADTVSANH